MRDLPPLRDWQRDALSRWISNEHRGIFEVATGGGKTTFALACFSYLREKRSDTRCLVILPTTALLDQWFLAFVEDLGVEEQDIKILSRSDLNPSSLVNLVIINSARGFNHESENPEELILIVDECHRAGSNENSKSLVRGTRATIGLSATPYRDFDAGFDDYVAPYLGPVLLKYSLEDAIQDGVLSNLNLSYVKIPLLDDEQEQYDALTGRIARAYRSQASSEVIESLLRQRSRVYNNAAYRVPVMASVLSNRRGKRTIVFVESISMAKEAKTLLDSSGHSVAIYHSKMSPHMRRANLRGFRKGVYDILIACRALDEGFNVPEAELAIIVAGTSSRRQRIQRVGRVLRSLEGKQIGEVVTLYATPVEEKRLIEESNSFDGHANIRWVEATSE